MSPAVYLAAVVTVAVGTCIQGSLGFGLGLVGAPVLALLDQRLVPGPLLLVGVVLTAVIAWRERAELDWHGMRWALVGRVVGTVVGGWLVVVMSKDLLLAVLAVLVLAGVALSALGWRVSPTSGALFSAGTMSGVMGVMTSVGGPPMAIVYQRASMARLRATLAGFFLFGATLAVITLMIGGELRGPEFGLGLVLLPGVAVGLVLARPVGRRLDRGHARGVILGFSAVTSLILLVSVLA